MQKELLDRLIETSIAPIADYTLRGNQLEVRIVRPDTSDPELERLQRGAKFVCHVESPNIVQNLEFHGIIIDSDVRSEILRAIRGEELATVTDNIDARGTKFDPDIYETGPDGKPVLTKFKTFKRKAA